MQTAAILELLQASNIMANEIELYREKENITIYLIDHKYILKISTCVLDDQLKQNRVKALRLAPKIHSSGSVANSGYKYNYVISDYVPGNDLWSIAQSLTDKAKREIGEEIAHFLAELHSITDDCYDIGHYIPTVPRCRKSWKEGHIEYVEILKNGISEISLEGRSKKEISKAFDYIRQNIDSLDYQAGARLLHNDLHPQNIVIHEGRLAGVIDWECSQYGEADFDLAHLFHWCVYPQIQDNNLDVLLAAVIGNLRITSEIPDIENRLTVYQLEHEINQLIWRGNKQEKERIPRINGWLNGKLHDCLRLMGSANE